MWSSKLFFFRTLRNHKTDSNKDINNWNCKKIANNHPTSAHLPNHPTLSRNLISQKGREAKQETPAAQNPRNPKSSNRHRSATGEMNQESCHSTESPRSDLPDAHTNRTTTKAGTGGRACDQRVYRASQEVE
jgi:hypothetical protein